LATNKIQPPPSLAKLLNNPALAEFDRFLYLLWQVVRNLDDSE